MAEWPDGLKRPSRRRRALVRESPSPKHRGPGSWVPWWAVPLAVVALVTALVVGRVVWHSWHRHHAQEGTVIALDHNPINLIVIPGWTSCSGNPPVCTYHPGYTSVIPENWNLRVRDDTDTEDWHEVDQRVYDGCSLGDYWPGEDGSCRPAR